MTRGNIDTAQIDRHVGKRLRTRRVDAGLSQTKLALLAGVTFQQIQKYERGVNRISASRLWLLAEALNVDVGFFFEDLRDLADENAERIQAANVERWQALATPVREHA